MSEDLNEFGTLVPKHLAEALKAEVERLKKFNEEAMAHIAKEERKSRERLEMAEDENARLKADVNELADGLKLASEVGIKMADEVTRLKAEVERLTLASQGAVKYVDHTMALTRQSMDHHKEVARLKTEVEHLMVFCNCTLIPNKELQAKVERLTKAGDAMVGLLEHMDVIVDMDSDHPEVEAWNAAKEGKQS
jgi:predicted RNase H-like nuclease (RuvC/YqgF family)